MILGSKAENLVQERALKGAKMIKARNLNLLKMLIFLVSSLTTKRRVKKRKKSFLKMVNRAIAKN